MNTALLLIDIQNDYFPGGAWELSHADEAAAQAQLTQILALGEPEETAPAARKAPAKKK